MVLDVLNKSFEMAKSVIYDPFRNKRIRDMEVQLAHVQKENDRMLEMVVKPDYNALQRYDGVQPVMLPVMMRDVYSVAKHSSVLRTITVNLKGEIFRQPPVWKPRFVNKCINCGHEHMKFVDACEDCGSPYMKEPNFGQLDRFEKFIACCNRNEQTMKSVFKQCEEDLDVIDDAYLILVKEYVSTSKGILGEKVIEMIRGDPQIMRIVANEKGEIGNKWWICPLHRSQEYFDSTDNDLDESKGRLYKSTGFCEMCGRKLEEVTHVAIEDSGGNGGTATAQYYIRGEVIHFSKYSPSILYGYSPVLSIWKEVSTLLNMANYINDSYKFQRTPKGALFVQTMNPESLYKKWDEIQERLRVDPHYTPILAIQGESSSRNKTEFIKFIDSLVEMSYGDARDEFRQRISALYGVTNIIMNDSSASGGNNNEGLQIKVTDRAVETGQNVWNEEVFPKLLKVFSITDWILQLQPGEETDKMKRVQLRTAEAQHAQIMQTMGFKVEVDTDNNFVFSGEAIDMAAQQEAAMQQESEQDMQGDDGMVAPGEDVDFDTRDPEYASAGGTYHEMYFDDDTDKREPLNRGSGELQTIDGELKKVVPWKRSLANGYRLVEIIRRDGQKQRLWVKAASDEELGKKRNQSADTHGTTSLGTRGKFNIQRRPHEEFKRDPTYTRMEQDEGVKNPGVPISPAKAKMLNAFKEANNDVEVNLTDNERAKMEELKGHSAAYDPETSILTIDAGLPQDEFRNVLEQFHRKLAENKDGKGRKA